MSSNCGNPSAETDALMPHKRKFDRSKTCIKCRVAPGNIVIRHNVYCKECFTPAVTSKFKRSLEPAINPIPDGPRKKTLNPSGNLLIGFSGGLGSTVLLDMIYECYFSSRKARNGNAPSGGKDPRHERVWKEVRVCYVEVCGAFPGMKDRTDDIRRVVEKYEGFQFVSLRVEEAFDDTWWESIGGKCSPGALGIDLGNEDLPISRASPSCTPNHSHQSTPLMALRAYLSSLPAPTALPTTLHTLTRLLLLHTALSTKSSHLLLGTCSTSLSISLISQIAQGGGFNVKEEVQEEWSPDSTFGGTDTQSKESVRVVRPLRDVAMKECAAFAWWSGLHIVGQEVWPGAKRGIGGITKDFIIGLEKDYPSTVSTIARTCGKLAPKGDVAGPCILCQRPAQSGVQDWKHRISLRSLDAQEVESKPLSTPSQPAGSNGYVSPSSSQQPYLARYLCYACHTTLTSKSSKALHRPTIHASQSSSSDETVPLPVWVQSRLVSGDEAIRASDGEVWQRKEVGQEEMKSVLRDFLLDE